MEIIDLPAVVLNHSELIFYFLSTTILQRPCYISSETTEPILIELGCWNSPLTKLFLAAIKICTKSINFLEQPFLLHFALDFLNRIGGGGGGL